MNYYLVLFALTAHDISSDRVHYAGVEAVNRSVERLKAAPSKLTQVQYAEVFSLPASALLTLQHRLAASGNEVNLPTDETSLKGIYIMNEVALKMYEEIGMEYQILQAVSEHDLPPVRRSNLKGIYVP